MNGIPVLIPYIEKAPESPNTIFEDIYNKTVDEIKARPGQIVERPDIVKIVYMMQEFEMDVHIVIAGQNGVGKSYVLLMFMKEFLGKGFLKNMLLAHHTYNDFVRFLLTETNTLLGVDEMNQYLYYKQHSDKNQNHLIKQMELARSKRIGVMGCVRDPRKLTLNYRQGKMSIVIWVLDRFTYGGSYAAVFVANPSVESYDKFGFGMIADNLTDIASVREVFEDMPSFVGYLRIPHIDKVLSKTEVSEYKELKDKAMSYAHINEMYENYRKRRITHDDVVHEIEMLRSKLGDEDADRLIREIPKRMVSR